MVKRKSNTRNPPKNLKKSEINGCQQNKTFPNSVTKTRRRKPLKTLNIVKIPANIFKKFQNNQQKQTKIHTLNNTEPNENFTNMPKKRGRPKKTQIATSTRATTRTQKLLIVPTKSEDSTKSNGSSDIPLATFIRASKNKDNSNIQNQNITTNKTPEDEQLVNLDQNVDETKDDFDRLLGKTYENHFHAVNNIKTYTNKKKKLPPPEAQLLEFQDCKNKELILNWLNNTENVFDRLTQTQCHQNDSNHDTQLSLNMPSVSQISPKKVSKRSPKKRTSPYKLRARSLDITINKKNSESGRNKTYSLSEDGQFDCDLESSDKIPAEKNAKIIIDYIEDGYIESLEQEMKQQLDNSVKNDNTVKPRTEPKKRNVSISPQKITAIPPEVMTKSFDMHTFENYLTKNIQKCMQDQSLSDEEKDDVELALDHGVNLTKILKTLLNKNYPKINRLNEITDELLQILQSYKNINLKPTSADVETQTIHYQTKTIATQTGQKSRLVDKELQTEEYKCEKCNEEKKVVDKNIQTEEYKCLACKDNSNLKLKEDEKLVQTTINSNELNFKRSSGTSTPSDIFIRSGNFIDKQDLFSDNLHDDSLDNFVFETEDILKDVNKVKIDEKQREDKIAINEEQDDLSMTGPPCAQVEIQVDVHVEADLNKKSEVNNNSQNNKVETQLKTNKENDNSEIIDLVCSGHSNTTEDKGLKRIRPESPQASSSKRPCNRFIQEDLSIAFDSCSQNIVNQTDKKDLFESDDLKYDQCITEMLKNIEHQDQKESKTIDTQEVMDNCHMLIENATKPPRKQIVENLIQSCDIFSSDIVLDAKCQTPVKTDLNQHENVKSVKRHLFDTESLFTDSIVLASNNATKDKVDNILKDVDGDLFSDFEEETQQSSKHSKINILQNIVIKKGDDQGDLTDDSLLSDVDIVESTPQKNNSRLSRCHMLISDKPLTPPSQFKDKAIDDTDDDVTIANILDSSTVLSPLRRPLASVHKNKVTSTPYSNRQLSENIPSLSPIALGVRKRSVLGPLELAQQSKSSPLTIVKKITVKKNTVSNTAKQQRQQSILSFVRPSQETNLNQSYTEPFEKKPCIACTCLKKEQLIQISNMTNKKLATYSTTFTSNVTHLIISTDETNCVKDHTVKYVSAIAAGIWVLNFKWVQQCLARNCLVSEVRTVKNDGFGNITKIPLMRMQLECLATFRRCILQLGYYLSRFKHDLVALRLTY